ncbi:MAG: DUF1819 family protein [Bacteroidota bacterium]
MRYSADMTAGGLKVPESRVIAGLLLQHTSEEGWRKAIFADNLLQARTSGTAKRLRTLLRHRLEPMGPELWTLIHDGSNEIATHASLAATIKQSPLLGDFLDLVVREEYRLFSPALSNRLWARYVEACRGRDPEMPRWSPSTIDRLRSSVFQTLAQAGYMEDTRSLKLQSANIAPPVLRFLEAHHETYVLRCIQVVP